MGLVQGMYAYAQSRVRVGEGFSVKVQRKCCESID